MSESTGSRELSPGEERPRNDANPLLLAACVVIVIAGLKSGASLIIPILMAALLTMACIPPTRYLRRWGVPRVLAIVLVVGVVIVGLVFLTVHVGNSIDELATSEKYKDDVDDLRDKAFSWLSELGADVTADQKFIDIVDTDALMQLVTNTANEVLTTLSGVFVILLIMIFMLFEVTGLPGKLRMALGDPDADLGEFRRVTDQIYGYLSIKACMSLVTGLLVAALTALAGIDFPVLWGLVAFLFNFVPTIGSIIAAIPAVLLALTHGLGVAAVVAAGYLAINLVIGNLIEPRAMGRRLGLSPLVVILSLIFWSWVMGPVGMLLSLPLTMVVKILFEHSEDLRVVAVLLGPAESRS